ncbi:MAG: hypothetical protein FJ027_12785 [Candidatus Rokubacteria bacterium]|nr:hypothetical protein [Candidatus Rokubacteria bacterium]
MSSSPAGWRAVGDLYHAYVTGLLLTTITRRSTADAAEFVFRIFRRQQLEKFLPGLEKLGLRGLPDAVACAQYHYLSNDVGGVRVEYIPETDRKAWVRYVPPRWIYEGATICAVPSDITRAILRGWHANNGVLLGNDRLGFVCTKMTTDGQPGLEGYYHEHERPLAPDERLRFAPDEDGPDFDPARAPRLDTGTWPAERLAKAMRNYAMTYVRTMLLELASLFGEDEARRLGGVTGRLIGMQYYAALSDALGIKPGGTDTFAELLTQLGLAQGDDPAWTRDGTGVLVRQTTWRLMGDLVTASPAVFDAWTELWAGALSIHDRRARLTIAGRPGDGAIAWRIAR